MSNASFTAGASLQLVGSISVDDPSDNVHVLSLVEGVLDNRLFALQGQQLFWNSAEPFPGQDRFEVRIQVLDRDGNTLTEDFTITRNRIALADMEIFNTFTPNGDGVNDTWGVRDLRFYEEVVVQVFDNSGRRLFLSRDPNSFWDGTWDGRTLPVGTYYYVIRVGETGETRKGFITLLKQ
ncbi:cadherin [Nitritalea halalkaliphila LW7]|uniref:Cadherin n=1 Tax=Nitritalea halalkaliphila LW7 TaxID=1189621 RepID=I5C9T3_9BACT|nr:cadherin [Nitritalea halalkaliphila LW7]